MTSSSDTKLERERMAPVKESTTRALRTGKKKFLGLLRKREWIIFMKFPAGRVCPSRLQRSKQEANCSCIPS